MSKSADRPDGPAERLVRMETRMVKYQQATSEKLGELSTQLDRIEAAAKQLQAAVEKAHE